jgi:hypothetical protein
LLNEFGGVCNVFLPQRRKGGAKKKARFLGEIKFMFGLQKKGCGWLG